MSADLAWPMFRSERLVFFRTECRLDLDATPVSNGFRKSFTFDKFSTCNFLAPRRFPCCVQTVFARSFVQFFRSPVAENGSTTAVAVVPLINSWILHWRKMSCELEGDKENDTS